MTDATISTRASRQYDPLIEHVALINRQIQQMHDLMIEAETRMLERLAAEYAAGYLDRWDLAAVLEAYRAVASQAYTNRWNAVIPLTAHTLFGIRAEAARRAAGIDRTLPNVDTGTWTGSNPIGREKSRPPDETLVVYVLYDQGRACHVGSTSRFGGRLRSHRNNGKRFTQWVAYACADTAAANVIMERLRVAHGPDPVGDAASGEG